MLDSRDLTRGDVPGGVRKVHRRLLGLVALMAVFALVAANAGSAAAAPKDLAADVEITDFSYECEYVGDIFAVSVTLQARALENTELDHMGIGVREYRPLPAETGDYFPFDTTIDVAAWYSHLDDRDQPLGPVVDGVVLHEMSTGDDDFGTNMKSHYWNTTLTDGNPDPGSWFLVEAWADGSVTKRGRTQGENGWDNEHAQVFLQCEPYGTFVPVGSPWEDWNWSNEP